MDHKESFLQYLQIEKRYSPLTVRSYLNDLDQFDNHLKLQDLPGKPEDVVSHDIRSWIVSLIERRLFTGKHSPEDFISEGVLQIPPERRSCKE